MLRFLQNSPHVLELVYAATSKMLVPFRSVMKRGSRMERVFIHLEK